MTEKEANKDRNLDDFLEWQLPIIDNVLAEKEVPLRQRPLIAAMEIVEHCILKIREGNNEESVNKQDYLGRTWFKHIYQATEKWYKKRYADALLEVPDDHFPGIVLIYETPFELRIPTVISEPDKEGRGRWISFPGIVRKDERVVEWLLKPPNLTQASRNELDQIGFAIFEVGLATRSIRINLMSANLFEAKLKALSRGIPSHIEKAVRDILSLDASRIAIASWELHLALEKSLKLLIRQSGKNPPRVHDLDQLLGVVQELGLEVSNETWRGIPSHKDVLKMRYGEGSGIGLRQTVENYNLILKSISKLTRMLNRDYILDDARFLIGSLPWKNAS